VLVIPSLSAVSETGDLRSLHPSVLLATAWFVGGLVVHRLWFRRESVAGESSMSAADTLGAGRSG
jgi:hypothetical protein